MKFFTCMGTVFNPVNELQDDFETCDHCVEISRAEFVAAVEKERTEAVADANQRADARLAAANERSEG